jgi:hypothetical protein
MTNEPLVDLSTYLSIDETPPDPVPNKMDDSTSHVIPSYFQDMAARMNEGDMVNDHMLNAVEFPFTVYYGFEATVSGVAARSLTITTDNVDIVLGGPECSAVVKNLMARLAILYGAVARVIVWGNGSTCSSIGGEWCVTSTIDNNVMSDEDILKGGQMV